LAFATLDDDAVLPVSGIDAAGGLISGIATAIKETKPSVLVTGDFVTPDEEMANATSEAAIALGCSVAFDERAGAEP
jgi:threonine dehydratase